MYRSLLLRLPLLLVALAAVTATAAADEASSEEKPVTAETEETASAPTDARKTPLAKATFGGGCFWCTEAIYDRIQGVTSVVSGYAGGHVPDPTYDEVCRGTTGHAECIQIEFDPEQVAFLDLLKVFFATHDPTTLNRQGADVGTQYRSVVFWHDEKQKRIAEKLVKELDASKAFPDPIVTEITKLDVFYPAERYHQEYYERNPRQGYCRVVIRPKVDKFEKAFAALLKKEEGEAEAEAQTPSPGQEAKSE